MRQFIPTAIKLWPPQIFSAGPGMISFCISTFVFSCCPAGEVIAHEFEDGHVERTVALFVEDDRVIVEYGIGCNENTMRELIERWNSKYESTNELENPADEDANMLEPADGNPTAESSIGDAAESESDSTQSQLIEAATEEQGESLQQSGAAESGAESAEESDEEETATGEIEIVEPDASQPEAIEGTPLEIESALLDEFADAAIRGLGSQISVTCNSVPGRMIAIEAGPSSRHHVDILVRMEFELFPEIEEMPAGQPDPVPQTGDDSDSGDVHFAFADGNFAENTGAVRYAMKARRDAFLKESNVAPLIVRAERIELNDLDDAQIKSVTTVNTVIGFVSR